MNPRGAIDALVNRGLVGWCLGGVSLGFAASMLIALTAEGGPFWSDGFLLALYLVATVALVAAAPGFIFGVPRARADDGEGAVRFLSNSNLEQISDWLTKILVGAASCSWPRCPTASATWEYLGGDLELPNGETASVAVVVYGWGVGFVFVYLWTRLRFRVLLESSERLGDEASRTKFEVQGWLGAAAATSEQSESSAAIAKTAAVVTDVAKRSPHLANRRVLWVDDIATNNSSERRALEVLGITVQDARSTQEALEALKDDRFALVITDLGRQEDGQRRDEAGLELIRAIREEGWKIPVYIYAGAAGLRTTAGADRRGRRRRLQPRDGADRPGRQGPWRAPDG